MKHRFQRWCLRTLRSVGIKQGLEFKMWIYDDSTGKLSRSADIHLVQGDSFVQQLTVFHRTIPVLRLEAVDQ